MQLSSLARRAAARVAVAWLSVLLGARAMPAQQRSPVDDAIAAITRAVNDLRYVEAIRLARDLEPDVARMRLAQAARYRQVFALAFFPEEPEFQRPDSALRQLQALVRIRPDAEFEPELKWDGLDSLLRVARRRTFAVGIDAPSSAQLAGASPTADIAVVVSRPARLRLTTVHRVSGRTFAHDSALVTERGVLRVRSHDGVAAWIATGEYDLRVTGFDINGRDSVVASRRLTATATALELATPPDFDSTTLQAEFEKPRRVLTAAKGLAFGVLTSAIATAPRGGGLLARFYDPDKRAGELGGAIVLGGIVAAALEKGRPVPAAVQANDERRRAHADRVAVTLSENGRRLATYRVTIRISEEVP